MVNLEDEYSVDELKLITIKNLSSAMGLDRKPWDFSRGAKTERLYKDTQDDATIMRVFYQYVYADGGTNKREIQSYTQSIEFYNDEGNVFLTTQVPNSLNIKNIKRINREIRQGRMDYLEAGAEQLRDGADQLEALAATVPEPAKTQYLTLAGQYRFVADSIDFIFSIYDYEITHYIARGTLDFENAVKDDNLFSMTQNEILAEPVEDQPALQIKYQIKQIFEIPVRQPDTLFPFGLTVYQSIIHQLTGEEPTS